MRKFIFNFFLVLLITQFNQKILIAQNNNYNKLLRKVYSLQYKGSYKKSEKILDEIIEIKPDLDTAYFRRGLARFQLLKYEDALSDFSKAINIDSSYTQPYFIKAKTLILLKRYNEAIRCYSDAIVWDTANVAYNYCNIAYVKYLLRDYESALLYCNKGLILNSNLCYLYSNKGKINLELGKYTEALEDFKKALILRPSDYESNEGIIRTYLALKDSLSACKYYYRAYLFEIDKIKDSISLACNKEFTYKCNNEYEKDDLDYFKNLALYYDKVDNSMSVVKWKKDIIISLKGKYSNEDLLAIKDFIVEVNPLIAPVKIIVDTLNPNVVIYFVPENEFSKYIDGFFKNNVWGVSLPIFSYDYEINNATIVISDKIPYQKARNWVIRHEVIHALGFLNHSVTERSNLFVRYNGRLSKNTLIDSDKFIIKSLYSDKILPGFNEKDIDYVICGLEITVK